MLQAQDIQWRSKAGSVPAAVRHFPIGLILSCPPGRHVASYASAVAISQVLPGKIAIDRGRDYNLTKDDVYPDCK